MYIRTKKNRGSILTIMLIVTILMGISMASYLKLVSSQNLSVQRSQNWNSAIAVAEAGAEEAMAHLNKNTTNRTRDSWTLNITNVVKSRTIDADNRYTVNITTLVEPPIIFAQGMVHIPKSDQWLVRTIKIGTTNDGFFVKAMAAKGTIDLNGNRITVDSFDSVLPGKNLSGKWDPTVRSDKGDVATNSKLIDSLSTGNADIWGHISTGPGGTSSGLPNGSVGDLAYHSAGKTGVEAGFSSDDMNVQFPDVQVPFVGGYSTPASGKYPPLVGPSYAYVVGTGNQQLSSLTLNSSEEMIIPGPGTTILYITGNVSVKGTITVAAGANLQLFVGGATADISGKGLVNKNANATTFAYWGLNSNTSVTFGGNAAFIGSIYAPYADLVMGGGGSGTPIDFTGSSISKTVKMNGKFNFHYDEALGRLGPRRGYTVTSWNEVAGF